MYNTIAQVLAAIRGATTLVGLSAVVTQLKKSETTRDMILRNSGWGEVEAEIVKRRDELALKEHQQVEDTKEDVTATLQHILTYQVR